VPGLLKLVAETDRAARRGRADGGCHTVTGWQVTKSPPCWAVAMMAPSYAAAAAAMFASNPGAAWATSVKKHSALSGLTSVIQLLNKHALSLW